MRELILETLVIHDGPGKVFEARHILGGRRQNRGKPDQAGILVKQAERVNPRPDEPYTDFAASSASMD
jgi:hypothetical protein